VDESVRPMLSEPAERLLANLLRDPADKLCARCAAYRIDFTVAETRQATRDLLKHGGVACHRDVCSDCSKVDVVIYVRTPRGAASR
jgi:hypothetical protein